MDITVNAPDSDVYVKHYQPGQLTLNTQTYPHSVLIYGDKVCPWQINHIDQLSSALIDSIVSLQPNTVIIGTGNNHALIDPKLLTSLYQQHIGVELMSTHAACRTFNIMIDEGRDVLAALIV